MGHQDRDDWISFLKFEKERNSLLADLSCGPILQGLAVRRSQPGESAREGITWRYSVSILVVNWGLSQGQIPEIVLG